MKNEHMYLVFASFSGAILLWMMLFLGTDDLSDEDKKELEKWETEYNRQQELTGRIVQPVCGDNLVQVPEECDPPGSLCSSNSACTGECRCGRP